MKYSEKLYQRYLNEIKSWDWPAFIQDAKNNTYEDYEGNTIASCYLGSILNVFPSGKYYMPWCSNQTVKDVIKDGMFSNALETVASEHNMYVVEGEGDSCDLYLEMMLADDDDIEQDSVSEDTGCTAEDKVHT